MLRRIRKGETLLQDYETFELGEVLDREAQEWCSEAALKNATAMERSASVSVAASISSPEGEDGDKEVVSGSGDCDREEGTCGAVAASRVKITKGVDFGVHLIADFADCASSGLLDNADALRVAVEESLTRGNLTLVAPIYVHRFQPTGLSLIAHLSESHLSMHTWPEHRTATVDVYACGGATSDPEASLSHLESVILPQVTKVTRLRRGVFETQDRETQTCSET